MYGLIYQEVVPAHVLEPMAGHGTTALVQLASEKVWWSGEDHTQGLEILLQCGACEEQITVESVRMYS